MTGDNDKLFDSLRKRQEEYHVPLRKDGWDKLEQTLASRSSSRRIIYRWISVAAVVLLAIAELPQQPYEPPVQSMEQQTLLAVVPPKKDIIQKEKDIELSATITRTKTKEKVGTIEVIEVFEESIESVESIESDVEEPITITETTQSKAFVGPEKEKSSKGGSILYTPSQTKNKGKWSWGISAGSNSTGATSTDYIYSDQPGNNPLPPVKPPIDEEGNPGSENGTGSEIGSGESENGSGDEGTKSFVCSGPTPQREVVQYKYHHRLPITVGISAGKRVSEHLILESGLTYTFLHSDISREGVAGYIGEQKLHYLGVPLKANWLFYNQGRFSVYASGGVLFEYCLSARQVIDAEKKDADMNRFQFSLGAAVGAQIRLVKPLSLYIEPGVSYYFDPGGSMETIRTEKPFMFNLQAGIRFTY